MIRFSIILSCFLLFLSKCSSPSVATASIDPDIVLVNIEQGDRSFIGKVLLKLDSLNPVVIAIDVAFKNPKSAAEDSILIGALKKIKNDILVYSINPDGTWNRSDSIFTDLVSDLGILHYEERMGLITTTIPLQEVKGQLHESLALKIIKYWKPDFVSQIKPNKRVDIAYKRNLENFFILDGSSLLKTNIGDLAFRNKVFLVGYTGPEEEDKFFTPLRYVDDKKYKANEPDTYGLVIIANEVRTILEYKN